MTYVALNRTTTGAEAFAESTYANLFSNWPDADRARFFPWATERASPCKFALVLATLHALKTGDAARAAALARRARGLLANDLYIQTLERRAAARPEPDLRGRFCRAPFESLETAPNGDVHFCCPAWLPVPIGNLNQHSPEEIWNSDAAQAIRASIHDGSYRFCSRAHCAHLSTDALPRTEALPPGPLPEAAAARRSRLTTRPRKLVLAHDRSCTLSCPSCRTEVITAKGAELARLDRLTEEVLLPLARDAERVRVTSSGDPFGSRHFRRLMKRLTRAEFPGLALEIQTNGVLFDAAAWQDLDLAGRLALVAVSLDATEPETYVILRRGGDFTRLMDNLAFLATRRRAGEIAHLRLDFVTQALNFREMPGLMTLAEDLGMDQVKFQMIRNWNTWTPEDFAAQDIGSRFHPDYPEFLDILRHPALASPRARFWGMGPALADAKKETPALLSSR